MESIKWGPVSKTKKFREQLYRHQNNYSGEMPSKSFRKRYLENDNISNFDIDTENTFYQQKFAGNYFQNEKKIYLQDHDDVYVSNEDNSIVTGSIHKTNENRIQNESTVSEDDHDFEFIKQNSKKMSSNWNHLDLKNRKQTGDLCRTMVNFSKKENNKIFAFLSSRPKEGVSTVLANLASYIDDYVSEKKTLVIDANLVNPSLSRLFGMPENCFGLTDIFNDRVTFEEAIIQIGNNLFLLSSGNISSGGSKNTIEQDHFNRLFNYCRRFFDFIIVDSSPVMTSSDSLTIASTADKVFLVIQYAQVQRPVAEKTKALLNNNECHIGGVILNRVKHVIPGWVYKFI